MLRRKIKIIQNCLFGFQKCILCCNVNVFNLRARIWQTIYKCMCIWQSQLMFQILINTIQILSCTIRCAEKHKAFNSFEIETSQNQSSTHQSINQVTLKRLCLVIQKYQILHHFAHKFILNPLFSMSTSLRQITAH